MRRWIFLVVSALVLIVTAAGAVLIVINQNRFSGQEISQHAPLANEQLPFDL